MENFGLYFLLSFFITTSIIIFLLIFGDVKMFQGTPVHSAKLWLVHALGWTVEIVW